MNVLYVNHTATVSGGERSLLQLLGALPGEVNPLVATPEGRLAEEVRRMGVPVATITGTAGSLRPHPLHTPKAVAEMALAARQVRRLAARHGAQVIHANSIRAGLVSGLACGRRSRPANVVHIRDCLPAGSLTSATMRLLAATADVLLANSHYTARWAAGVARNARIEVAHNGVDVERFDPAHIDRDVARAGLGPCRQGAAGFRATAPGADGQRRVLLGVVGQLSPWKGQDTAIGALALLRDQGVDAHLLLVGSAVFVAPSTRLDNEAYVARLHDLVTRLGLGDRVSFLGERSDVPEIMRALDVLLSPSVQEPFGRAVIEAMAMEVPVIATTVGGPAEIVTDGVQGYLRPPGEPRAWAQAVAMLVADPELAADMGRRGRERVLEAFTTEQHARVVVDIYRQVVGDAGGAA